jgi:hypothetical protein
VTRASSPKRQEMGWAWLHSGVGGCLFRLRLLSPETFPLISGVKIECEKWHRQSGDSTNFVPEADSPQSESGYVPTTSQILRLDELIFCPVWTRM